MSLLVDQYGQPLPYAPSGRHLLNATQQGPNVPAIPTIFEDISKSVPVYDWRFLVSASRRLYLNVGPFREAIDSKAMASVGNAWQPYYHGRNKAWGIRAKKFLIEEYYPSLDLRGYDHLDVLYLASVCIDRDCDMGALMTERADGFPAIQMVPTHRIGNRGLTAEVIQDGEFKGLKCLNGIIVDEFGTPVGGQLLGDQPDADQIVDFGRFIHLFDPMFIEQNRGFPAALSGIRELRTSMKASEYEEFACLVASAISLIEENETGTGEDDGKDPLAEGGITPDLTSDIPRPNLAMEAFYGGLIRYFKAGTGSKLSTFQSQRPGPQWESFQDRLYRAAICPVWPYEMVWKTELRGPEVRLVQGRARRFVADRITQLRKLARRFTWHGIAKAIELDILPPDEDWQRWGHSRPALLSIDQGRDENSTRENYKLGIVNLGEILAEDGRGTVEDHWRERAHEVITKKIVVEEVEAEYGGKYKIEDHELQMFSPNEVAPAPKPADDEKDPAKKPDDKEDEDE